MFGDIGWSELLLIGIVALIVIGPEDLPQMFRQVGRFTAKMRAMSRDFSRAMDQAAKDSGVKDVTDTVKGATSATSLGLNKVKAAADRFEKWDPMSAVKQPVTKAAPAVVTDQAISEAASVEPTIHGAETQALLKKQAAKKAVLVQTAEKLKAINSGSDEVVVPSPAPPRSPKPKPARAAIPELVVAKPRAPRKSKKANEA